MDGTKGFGRRTAAAVAMALGLATGLAAGSAQANVYESSFVKGRFVQVDVYDRANGTALPVYASNGRNYIVGAPGHEYGVRVRNCTGNRVLVVSSVDGVNVISGETAAPSQDGYVLEPYGYVVITGWRKNLDRTAAFYFTDLGDSYAARTGRPLNVGVIGVAVFQEREQPIAKRAYRNRDRLGSSQDLPAPAPAPASRAKSEAAQPMERQEADAAAQSPPLAQRERADVTANESGLKDQRESSAKTLGKLGTGHGRSEDSRVTVVAFEPATVSPAEILAIQYDRRENLAAMGVLPPPHYARRTQPDPFPGTLRFAPDPR